ncbi:hypothetical protein DFH06DRAFT_253115 [Mycena polygramma]|nr:hypothetical protein DFH06DRAFT_253115 [Mycena polygramma]
MPVVRSGTMTSDSSSASESPMLLTPDSTGAPDAEVAASKSSIKKSRRQTAFYPNVNSSNKPQKPFSRSAAKRESVMALGSIEHLQHYFTKTGIEAKKNSKAGKSLHGLVPVFGGLTHSRNDSTESNVMDLPPSPVVPQPAVPHFPPYVKTFEMDPESLLPGVIDDLADVSFAWRIDQTVAPTHALTDRLGVAGLGPADSIDVLTVLKTTTRAIRSVRNYLLSLPDESAGTIRAQFRSRQAPGSFRPLQPSNLSASRSITDLRGAAAHAKEKEKESRADPLTLIRKSALEVLTVLRELEERCRLPLSDDAYDAQSDGGGGHSRMASPSMHSDELSPEEGDHEREAVRDADTSVAFSLVQVQGRYESVPVWEDEEETWQDDDDDKDKAKKEGWDEKLVLGSGWLYQQNVRLEDLEKERAVVGTYLDVVDEVLFEGKKTGEAGKEKERGWEREKRKAIDKGSMRSRSRANRRASSTDGGRRESKGPTVLTPSTTGDKARRRISVGMFDMMSSLKITEEPSQMGEIDEEGADSEDSIDDEELPEWARRKGFEGDELGRVHSILSAFLPAALLPALLPASPRDQFLDCLSSGQLLCVAYNACVRKSKKPWGYISRDGIHDILALEQAARDGDPDDSKAQADVKKGWTFRRIDNLRLWAGALKIRYLLPIVAPAQPGSTTPNSNTPLNSPAATARFTTDQPPVIFDAKAVARKDPGWEDILEGAMVRWVQRVVAERRGET